MAYAKFTPRNTTTNNSYDVHYMTKSIQDFLQGTNWTTQSDASGSLGFNGSAGTVAGTYPTSGIYNSVSVANQSTGGELSFYKKHYAHSQFTGDPQLKVVLRISSSDGWRIHIYDRNGSNISPNTNVSTGIGGSTTAYMNAVPPVGADYGQVLDSVHIIANDTTFAIKIISGGGGADNTPTTTDHGWMVLNDIEYNPILDTGVNIDELILNDLELNLKYAQQQGKIGNYKQTIATLERLNMLYPDNVEIKLYLLSVLVQADSPNKALTIIEEIRTNEDLTPEDLETVNEIESALKERGKPKLWNYYADISYAGVFNQNVNFVFFHT